MFSHAIKIRQSIPAETLLYCFCIEVSRSIYSHRSTALLTVSTINAYLTTRIVIYTMASLSSGIDIVHELEQNQKRVISLIDLDCFYAQVEAKRHGIDSSVPLAVQQWGAVIAVNYKSREYGVKRGQTLNEILRHCPNIKLCHVDVVNENGEIIPGKFTREYHEKYKVTLDVYRKANFKILDIFRRYSPTVERASIDEAYLDLTEVVAKRFNAGNYEIEWKGKVIGGEFVPKSEADIKLMIGAQIINTVRSTVHSELGYTCSAGIAHNKKFAKFICSFNKPDGQTVLPTAGLSELLPNAPIEGVQGFGGKLGQKLKNSFGVTMLSDITQKVGYENLSKVFEEATAKWIWRICHGIDFEEVKVVGSVKRIGSSKNLRGVNAKSELVQHLKICASELLVRIRLHTAYTCFIFLFFITLEKTEGNSIGFQKIWFCHIEHERMG